MLITLMGKSGSGKTTISLLFKEIDENIQILDVDKIVHRMYYENEVKDKVIDYFGVGILDEKNEVSRKKLSKIVFQDKSKMKLLCEITYSYLEKQIDLFIKQHEIVLLDYALIPKTKYYAASDLKILALTSKDERARRIEQRDKISLEDFILRDNNSLNYSEADCDFVIVNNGNIFDLRKAVQDVYDKSFISGKF